MRHAVAGGGAVATILMKPYQRACGDDWPPFAFTMVGMHRLVSVAQMVAQVVAEGVPGGFAELGVWRGGTCILAAKAFGMLTPARAQPRQIHVFDAFEKLPGYKGASKHLANSAESVRQNFAQFGCLTEHVHFEVGRFQQTTKAWRAQHDLATTSISILRLDCNFYDSHSDAMYNLYDYVPVGGFVIFDDVMSEPAVMRFWLDFKNDQKLPETLTQIDGNSAYFRKVKAVQVDLSLAHPPEDVNRASFGR
mmetsp:Transcript_42114/g.101410  ORF Transcript_42114/g.101410 Transcript_42114/m.101410 type:complete len:250 (-) Transcript_42114:620-1369(-)